VTVAGRIRVVVVDDHDMLREGIATFLRASSDLELVGEASNGLEAIEVCLRLRPDVVLMDLEMPELDGVQAITAIHRAQPEIRLIALSSFGDERRVRAALGEGATSYLMKNISASGLADAIRATRSGMRTLAPDAAAALMAPHATTPALPGSVLTERELEVLGLLVEGLSNTEMAVRMHVSPNTVKNHVSSVLGKLGVSSRTQAVSLALQHRVVRRD
jgi:NarL family two-component system response regulator LiaR